ncbi:hypothetical protein SEA_SHAM_107 [Streptomyces phage Sham]|nr:hypothetical protein SEA_SHAM_107 [Streptomyces phage Sham]
MPRRKFFYDTEFHEDGKTIDLISIGIVRGDGKEYYAVSSEADYKRVYENSWLMNHVMNSIPHLVVELPDNGGFTVVPTGPYVKSRAEIREDIIAFVNESQSEFMDPHGEAKAELWAWYGDYDHVALCQLFGKMIDLPEGFPMFTRDLRQHWEYKGYPELPKQDDGEHNSLDDARYNKIMWEYLESLS